MNNSVDENYKQIENEDFDGEITHKGKLLELLKYSTLPLIYMTEGNQKDVVLYREGIKKDEMIVAWVIFVVCDKEIVLEAINHPKRFRFFNEKWKNDEEIAFRAIQLYPQNDLYSDCFSFHSLRNIVVTKKQVPLTRAF